MAERNAVPPHGGSRPEVLEELAQPSGRLLLTAREVVYLLGMGRTFVYQLMKRKQLFSVKIGGARRVPVEAVHAFVNELIATRE